MKKTELSFRDGFLGIQAENARAENAIMKAFDWDKAAKIIKDKFNEHPDLYAEAGLQRDWSYTAGTIFESGKPTNESYTYLCSNWAIPTLILEWDGKEQEEIECWIKENDRMTSSTKWDKESLEILGINL